MIRQIVNGLMVTAVVLAAIPLSAAPVYNLSILVQTGDTIGGKTLTGIEAATTI